MTKQDEKLELIDLMNERVHQLKLNWKSLQTRIGEKPDVYIDDTIKTLQDSVDLLDSVNYFIESLDASLEQLSE